MISDEIRPDATAGEVADTISAHSGWKRGIAHDPENGIFHFTNPGLKPPNNIIFESPFGRRGKINRNIAAVVTGMLRRKA